jgi:hypothetical protein
MVTDDPALGLPLANDPTSSPVRKQSPLPVPDLAAFDSPVDSEVVSDEDRNRYGLLLDSAAQRGLLSPFDYEIRLRDLASATTIDQMNDIVTELPVFTATASATLPKRPRRLGLSPVSGHSPAAPGTHNHRGRQWLMLAILVVAVIVSLVLLSIYSKHLIRNRNSGLPTPAEAAQPVSGLRL